MTTTHITSIAHLIDLDAVAGEFADDYDIPAATAAYFDAVDALTPEGVYVLRNGDVLAEVETADAAREIDWRELVERVDVAPILKRHEI